MSEPYKIGLIGTDGRSYLGALEISKATSDLYPGYFHGIIVRGTPAMPVFAEKLNLPIGFIPTGGNSVDYYAKALIRAFRRRDCDLALVMPEALIFDGLVDRLIRARLGKRIIGLDGRGAFLEGNKIKCKWLCKKAGIPVAPAWKDVDVRDYTTILGTCLDFLHEFGGAVLKYPYSAGGKGAREILSTWDIGRVYRQLIADYTDNYKELFGERGRWPLLIEARMAGTEISFTVLVDSKGNYALLPTAMDYPRRFAGPPSNENPVTGGMGSISPHPLESPGLMALAEETIIRPLIEAMRKEGILRPCVLYPGCFVSFDNLMRPEFIRVCEINVRPGEPEFQPVVKRLRNLGPLLQATAEGKLNHIEPEIRKDQLSMCIALVTGPGGPKKQKGYPGPLTKGEPVEIDWDYFKKKKITVIPSAMDCTEEGIFKSDGSRVAYVIANATVKSDQKREAVAEALRQKLYDAINDGKIRVIPRENESGNRLAWRPDIGLEYQDAALIHTPR